MVIGMNKSGLAKKADKLFADYWKNEIGKCERCGRKNEVQLQLAHIITRGIRKLRYDRDNTIVLCASCHRHMHNKPLEFYDLVKKLKGDEIIIYLKKASNILKPISADFYKQIIEKYK